MFNGTLELCVVVFVENGALFVVGVENGFQETVPHVCT